MIPSNALATCTWALRLTDGPSAGAFISDPSTKGVSYSIGNAYLWLSESRARAFIADNEWARGGVPQRARP